MEITPRYIKDIAQGIIYAVYEMLLPLEGAKNRQVALLAVKDAALVDIEKVFNAFVERG